MTLFHQPADKVSLYNTYILPILLYGADTWSMKQESSRRIDAFDQCCLCRILRIPYTAHITNKEVRRRTNQDSVTSLIKSRRLRLFGHIARADPSQDHQRALRAAINRLQADWQRPRGRPRRTWLSTVELNHTTSASTRCGSGHRTVQNGVNLWRRLWSLRGEPPDDNDDDRVSHL